MKLVSAAMILCASQASALSCMAPDPIDSFAQASASTESYILVLGEIAYDTADWPENSDTMVSGRLVGKALTAGGFDDPYNGPISLNVTCAGPFCGTVQPDVPALVFAQIGSDSLLADVPPCGGWVFENPTSETLRDMGNCLRNGGCSAQPLQ